MIDKHTIQQMFRTEFIAKKLCCNVSILYTVIFENMK